MDKAEADKWAEVGAAIRARLGQLPESQTRLCARMGISSNKFRQIRDGKAGNYRDATLVSISLGLWGKPDALARVLDGRTPTDDTMPLGMVSTGWGDLNELRALDPKAHAIVMETVAMHLDRARRFKGGA